ncbi:MAG: methyltransferase [Candidatus Micrarchaeota archaeon]|nr:methyltransferase [Candidatus Micrarchaeota archaeon]
MALHFGALQIELLPTVYEPAEDSFLLATYASSLSGKILDMGTGSGIAALSAAQASPKNEVVGVDINKKAVECARKNAVLNKIKNVRFFLSDLFSNISGRFDAILFNPPYLPTKLSERLKIAEENAAYDGGRSGLEVFYRFADQAGNFIVPGGRVAVIATSLNDGIRKAALVLEKKIGRASVLAQESFFFERIALLEAVME